MPSGVILNFALAIGALFMNAFLGWKRDGVIGVLVSICLFGAGAMSGFQLALVLVQK